MHSQFATIERHCIELEQILRALLQDMHDPAACTAMDPMFRADFWSEYKIFRIPQTVPLIQSIGMVEQMWPEWHRPEYEENCQAVLFRALNTLTGARVLIHTDWFSGVPPKPEWLKRRPMPEWYNRLLYLLSTLIDERQVDLAFMNDLVETIAASEPSSIAGHLTNRILAEVAHPVPINPWDAVLPQDDFYAEMNTEAVDHMVAEWDPSKVNWSRIDQLVRQLRMESQFSVQYICRGWRCVTWTMYDKSPAGS